MPITNISWDAAANISGNEYARPLGSSTGIGANRRNGGTSGHRARCFRAGVRLMPPPSWGARRCCVSTADSDCRGHHAGDVTFW
jgi:hypothetical protein